MDMNDPRNCEDTNSEVEKLIKELGPKRYSHVDLERFTSNFSKSNIVGSGGYGVVYKGQLPDGVEVAVKRLEHKDVVEEFLSEVSTISNANHRNLIKLKGYCFEPNMSALVYEYMESGSLDKILYKHGSSIEWGKFYGIAIEIAKGLDYLHDGSHGLIIHYDIKAGNVLLDKNLSPKITDFGMAKLVERNVSHVPLTRTRGTPGYNAPETWMPGSQVTYKCDVYSFGMMLFELLGKRNNGRGENWFPRQVWENFERGQLEHELNYIGIEKVNIENAKLLSMVALWCIQFKPENRPTMREVVSMLEKTIQVKRPPNPFPFWQFPKLPSLEGISEDDLENFYSIDGRTIQDAESFSSSLEDTTPGSTVLVQEQNQVIYQPSTIEDELEGTWKKIIYENGTAYEGTWKNGLREGQGKFCWTNGDVYIGEWKDDHQEGLGKFFYENGDYYEGAYKKSMKEGHGKFLWANGDEYIGEFINNFLEGHGKLIYKNGNYHEGTYKKSLKEGEGRYVMVNGDEYIGEYRNDIREGHGRYHWGNGNEYIGEYKNGVQEGQGRFIWANGDEYIGEFKNNFREGHGKLILKNGNYYEGTYKKSIKEGQGRSYWANGDEYIGEYKKGVQEGHGRFSWANGDEYIGEFKNDFREGQGKIIWKNGDYYEGAYKKSKKEGQGRFVAVNGNEYIGEYRNGVREGQGRFIYKNGSYHEGTYRNGLKDGPGRFVSANGEEYCGEWIKGVRQ